MRYVFKKNSLYIYGRTKVYFSKVYLSGRYVPFPFPPQAWITHW